MQYRKDRKKNRIKYKGYGFTLEGKIKASMKAGAKNAITGLGHTAVNAVGNAMSQVEASVKLMSIYNDKNRYLKLKSACSQMVFRVFKKVQIINDKESDIKVVPLTNENVKKAEAIFNNIQNGVIKESDACV